MLETPKGSNERVSGIVSMLTKVKVKYPVFNDKSNSAIIWSPVMTFPENLFWNRPFTITVFTEMLPDPLHLKPYAGSTVKELIFEVLRHMNLYPRKDIYVLKLCGSEEFLQNGHTLGSHESIQYFQKFNNDTQLQLLKQTAVQQHLARAPEDDQTEINLNLLLGCEYVHSLSRSRRLLTVLESYSKEMENLLKQKHKVDNVVEEVKSICSLLCSAEIKEITVAVEKLCLVPLKKERDCFYFSCFVFFKDLLEKAMEELSAAISQLIFVYCSSFNTDFQSVIISPSPPIKDAQENSSNFSFIVYAVHKIPEKWMKRFNFFSVSCSLTYAGKQLCRTKITGNISVRKYFFMLICWNERIEFPFQIKTIPCETMLTLKLCGSPINSKNITMLGWTALPLYSKRTLIYGTRLLSLALQTELPLVVSPGVSENCHPEGVILEIKFPEVIQIKFKRPDPNLNRTYTQVVDEQSLKEITNISQKQSLLLLSEKQKTSLWNNRLYCNSSNCFLPLVLGSAPVWSKGTLSDIYLVLKNWSFSNPLDALGLLTSSFPDQEVRKTAVQQLKNLSNDYLVDYLPQLVQAVKFEWNLDSPLVKYLLECSMQNSRVAHQFYWLLETALEEDYFHSWYWKLLAALKFCVGKSQKAEWDKQRTLINIIAETAEKVREAENSKRQEVIQEGKVRLEKFFQRVHTCRLPLNQAYVVKGIDADGLAFFPSNAVPLKVSFLNADPLGQNINIIFKTGDDMRQDILVLQIARIMNRIWLQEGLDMQMITYRCISTGKRQGLVEMVPNATTLAKIHRQFGLTGPLNERTIEAWFSHHNPTQENYEMAVNNFVYSCAGWCVVTFILGVCDRHNDNIMLKSSGHMFHIDFGKFLGHAQMCGTIQRDRAPFIFTSEMEYFITEGKTKQQHFRDFVEHCCQAYNIIRKHSQLFMNLVELMLPAGMPELEKVEDMEYVYQKLRPQDSDLEATSFFTRKIRESLECLPVKLNNLIHTLANMQVIDSAKENSQFYPLQAEKEEAEKLIEKATIVGFNRESNSKCLYSVTVVQTKGKGAKLIKKSYEEFCDLHKELKKCFPSLPLPEFTKVYVSFRDIDKKRMNDIKSYLENLFSGSYEVAKSKIVKRFFLDEPHTSIPEESGRSVLKLCFPQVIPSVQLLVTHKDNKLSILIKHFENIHLMDGSAPNAYVEIYLLPGSKESTLKRTKFISKNRSPAFNEIIEYDGVEDLQGHVMRLIVKSKAIRDIFLGATDIPLSTIKLNEEKWYPLGNCII
uniref:Phosphatidylinositol-4-phosphate 3-kinase catalytic subunit type 2 gamma n=1 Tax=Latimeria chalumnae TaxID=7897 RepID=H3A4E8_LATCH